MTHTFFFFFPFYISPATLHNNAVAAAKLAARRTGTAPAAGKVTLSWHWLQPDTKPGNENRTLLASTLICVTTGSYEASSATHIQIKTMVEKDQQWDSISNFETWYFATVEEYLFLNNCWREGKLFCIQDTKHKHGNKNREGLLVKYNLLKWRKLWMKGCFNETPSSAYPSLLPSTSGPAGISRKRLSSDRAVSQEAERRSFSW